MLIEEGALEAEGAAGAFEDALDDFALEQEVGARDEVLVHEELGDREGGEHGAGLDLPPRLLEDQLPEALQQQRNVDAGVVLGELLRVESGVLELVVATQQSEQCDVELGVGLFGEHERVGLARCAAPDVDGQEEQGGVAVSLGGLFVLPAEHPEGEVGGDGAAFLETAAARAKELQQALVEVGSGVVGEGLTPLGEGHGELWEALGVRCAPLLGTVDEWDGASVGEPVFEGAELVGKELHRGASGPEVEQPISQAQVEQLFFPLLEAVTGGSRSASGEVLALGHGDGGPAGGAWQVDVVRVRGVLHGEGERPKALGASGLDVDQEEEAIGVVEVLAGRGACRVEGRTASEHGGLEQEELTGVHGLADRDGGVVDGLLVGAGLQPDAREGMALDDDNHSVQPTSLEDGREGGGQVEAGTGATANHLCRAHHLLAGLLEAGGRGEIGDAQLREREPDRLDLVDHLLPQS